MVLGRECESRIKANHPPTPSLHTTPGKKRLLGLIEGALIAHGGAMPLRDLLQIFTSRGYHKLSLLQVLPHLCHVEDDVASLFSMRSAGRNLLI